MASNQTYVNGVAEGPYKEYDKDGKIILEGQYIKGVREGIWTKYDETGKKSKIKYKNDEEEK
jgi:antitoxin component YwqK of YwqJK toxin-antitoxin module